MKFSGKMGLMIILKVTKSQKRLLPLSRRYIFGKTEERRGSHQGLNRLLTLMYISLHYSIVK